MEGGGVEDEEIKFEMPFEDDQVGTCGIGVGCAGRCEQAAVGRVEINAYQYDWDQQAHDPYYYPYVGEAVMVDVCAKHQADIREGYVTARDDRRQMVQMRVDQAKRVEALREELAEAESVLKRL
jgi:hypothetical protein